jgi:subtilase family serine protease
VNTGGCLQNATGCFHQVSGVKATAADVRTYEAAFGPDHVPVTLKTIPVEGVSTDPFDALGHPVDHGGLIETDLDIEVAIAIAPGLSKVTV